MVRSLFATTIAAFAGVTLSASLAGAVTIFEDDFNRADSSIVGNGWTEFDAGSSSFVSVSGNQLRLLGTGSGPQGIGAGVAQVGNLSTIGLTDIRIQFDFTPLPASDGGLVSAGGDRIRVDWKLSGDPASAYLSNFVTTLSLGANPVVTVSVDELLGAGAANQAGIDLRIYTLTDQANEGTFVDNVRIVGTTIGSGTAVPLAGTLPLLALGLAGIVALRRRSA